MKCYKDFKCVGCPHYYNESIEPKSCHALDDIDFKFCIGDVVIFNGDKYLIQDINFVGGNKVTYSCLSLDNNNDWREAELDENLLEEIK